MFEVSYGTSADMDYCPCCGSFINGKECCDVEDDDSYKHICEAEVAEIVKRVNEKNDPKIYVEINRKPCPNPDEVWYTEKWLYQDIIYALEDADVPATEENIFLVESRVKKGFDDKSDRNEMIADIVDELF